MYSVEEHLWVRVAAGQMMDAAEHWLQSVADDVRKASWSTFGHMVLERFGKDQHELLIRQLFTIRMTGTVSEYMAEYSRIVEQLIAYGRHTDPLYFAMRFVDGLRDDIRQAVHMHRPSTLDTACSLALLQEEMIDSCARSLGRKMEAFGTGKYVPRGPLPPQPPPRPDKLAPGPAVPPPEDRRIRGVEDKLATLRNYRRALGLCYRCGEKWARDHRCPEQIALHILQETWEMCQDDDEDTSVDYAGCDQVAHCCVVVSVDAVHGVQNPRTI